MPVWRIILAAGILHEMNAAETRICHFCGLEFITKCSTSRPWKGICCSVSCRSAHAHMNVPGWSANHEALVAALYHDFSYREIAEMIGIKVRTVDRVIRRRVEVKKSNHSAGAPWSEPEIEVLRDLFPHMSGEDLQALLGRSATSIRHKAHKLGIPKSLDYLTEIKALYLALPPEIRELNTLTKQIKRKLDEEHLRPARSTVRTAHGSRGHVKAG